MIYRVSTYHLYTYKLDNYAFMSYNLLQRWVSSESFGS